MQRENGSWFGHPVCAVPGQQDVGPDPPDSAVVSGLVATAEDDRDGEHESQATDAAAPVAETPTCLQKAGAGMAEAQVWKGNQIAEGWRKLLSALRRPKEGDG
jgi:hypothetical protein